MKKIDMKKITAVSLAVLMGVSLAACGSSESSSTTTAPESSTSVGETTSESASETSDGEKTKVVVWSKNSHDLEYMTEKVKEYNITNTDNIEVEYVVQSSSDYLNLITMSASSGQSPDIFSNTTVNLSEFAQEAGVLTDQFPAENEWAVAQLPTLDGEIKGALSCNPNTGWFMSGNTKNKEAAWKVIEYFQSEDFLKGYIEGGYALPISTYMDSIVDKTKMGRLAQFELQDYEAVYPQAPNVTPAGETYRDALWNSWELEIREIYLDCRLLTTQIHLK
jgi:ABC-type glycerol-3-phosphate transport system substrate-binding protein